MNKPIKKTLYPKTERIKLSNEPRYIITEKLDGSNLGIFKSNSGLIIAQRNNVFFYVPWSGDTNLDKDNSYKGLLSWLEEHGQDLYDSLHPTSGVFGEWLAMGKINYAERFKETYDTKRFYVFAKANINEDLEIKNLYYNPELLKYPFVDQDIPSYIGVVPIVAQLHEQPSVSDLDKIYYDYVHEVNGIEATPFPFDEDLQQQILEDLKYHVEGFVVQFNNNISKYVRHKNKKLEKHKS